MHNLYDLTCRALQEAKIEFLVTDDTNTIIATSNPQWAGRPLLEAIPALNGMEDVLSTIAQGDLPSLHIPYIRWEDSTSEPQTYYSLRITPYTPAQGLFLVIHEETEIALLMQELNQKFNELALLHEKLEEYTQQLEEANQQLKTLNQERAFLISIINHDIRTPLAVIQNLLTVLLERESSLDEKWRRDIKMALDATQNARELAGLVLQIERIHQATHTDFKDQVDLSALIREVVNRYRPTAIQQHVHVFTVLRKVPQIRGDWALLRAALGNLLDNAIKYNKPNGTVIIRLEEEEEGIQVVVEDTGEGFETEDISELIQPFRRGPQGKRRQGTGLGLYIVHRIVTLHHGRMWVRNRADEGSQVFIWLPLNPSASLAGDAR